MERLDEDDDGSMVDDDSLELKEIGLDEVEFRPVPPQRASKQKTGHITPGFDNAGFDSNEIDDEDESEVEDQALSDDGDDDGDDYDDDEEDEEDDDVSNYENDIGQGNKLGTVDDFKDNKITAKQTLNDSHQEPAKTSVPFNNKPKSILRKKFSDDKQETSDRMPHNNAMGTQTRTVSVAIPDDSEDEDSEYERDSIEETSAVNLQNYIERLRQSGKIEQAALIDISGNILITSRGMNIKQEDAVTIMHVLNSPDRSLVKLRIGKEDFTCFKNSATSFIGRSELDFVCVSMCLDFVVIGISDPNSPGSCIHEVTRFAKRCNRESNLSFTGFQSASV